MSTDQPNIILISLDAVRADHLSCYGYRRSTSPFIDQLAQESVLYESAYSATRWTLPAHASMFTGTYLSKHGVGDDKTRLRKLSDLRFTTLAEYLHAREYQTVGFSNVAALGVEMHFDRGFDRFYQNWTLFDERHPLYHAKFLGKYWGRRLRYIYENRKWFRSDKGGRKTNHLFSKWLRHKRHSGQPFFAFFHYFEAHGPYWPPRKYRSLFTQANRNARVLSKAHADPWDVLAGNIQLTDDETAVLESLYDAEIRYLDHLLTELVELLQKQGELERTMIILTADHGESFGDHGCFQHSAPCLYESVVRVPLLIRYAPQFPAGTRVTIPVSLVDIFPTITQMLEQTQKPLHRQLQGSSLAPDDLARNPDRIVVMESLTNPAKGLKAVNPNFDTSQYDYYLRAVRWRDYKFIWRSSGIHELYHLSKDPHETTNLIHQKPAIVRDMQGKLEDWLASFDPYSPDGDSVEDLSNEVIKRLHALGYLEL